MVNLMACIFYHHNKKKKTEGATSEEGEESVESIFWTTKKVFQEGRSSHLGKMVGRISF